MTGSESRPWRRPLRQVRGGAGLARLLRAAAGGDIDPDAARALAETLGRLRGPATKFAQILATLPGAVDEPLAEALGSLRQHAPPMRRLFVLRRLERALGADWRRHFARFEETPRFAASLGQVHYGALADGRAVAVKIQYPDMATALAADLANLRLAAPLLRRAAGIDITDAIEELEARFGEELDYEREAAHMRAMRAALEPEIASGRLALPEPVDRLTRTGVLTMTWICGRHLLDVAPVLAQRDRDRLAADLVRAWYRPFFTRGLLHGDPHPGNILWQEKDGRLALVDFGCMRSYGAGEVAAVRALPGLVAGGTPDRIAAALAALGFADLDDRRLAALMPWLEWLFAPFLAGGRRPFLPADRLAEGRARLAAVRARIREAGGIRLPRAFVLLHRSAVVLGSVITRLEAEGDWRALWEEVASVPPSRPEAGS